MNDEERKAWNVVRLMAMRKEEDYRKRFLDSNPKRENPIKLDAARVAWKNLNIAF